MDVSMRSALGVLAEFPPPRVVRDLKRGVVAASGGETASVFGAGAADERVVVLERIFVMVVVVVGANVQKGVVGAYEGRFSICFFFQSRQKPGSTNIDCGGNAATKYESRSVRLSHNIACPDFILGSPSRIRPGCFEHKVEEKMDAIIIRGIKLPGIGRTIESKRLVTVSEKKIYMCACMLCVPRIQNTLFILSAAFAMCGWKAALDTNRDGAELSL